ncbi:hypothetical protein PUR_31410 [Paenibacillus sp. URB8-2]|nr:hypothetical protein PUR_31410 [Paenibacillus sp. URB8-2]
MTVGFSLGNGFGESVKVKLVDFTTGERQLEVYSFPKKLEQINDGETVDVKLSMTTDSPSFGISGESSDTYTYKDKSGDILSINAASKGTNHDSYILIFNYTKKTLTKVITYKNAFVHLDKNYTYEVFRVYPGETGIYSIFTNQKIGYTYPTHLNPNYWDKYSLSVTPRDYIIPLKPNDNESYVKIKPDGSYTPIKNMWKQTYGAGNFVINVTNNIKVEGIIGGRPVNPKTRLNEQAPNYFYRVQGKTRTLLNKNKVLNSELILSPDNKYALIVEAYPTKEKWIFGNPEKVIYSIYDLVNNKLIKSFQSPKRLNISVTYTQWYSNSLARFSFGSSNPDSQNIFYLHLPTGLLTYQGREQYDYARYMPQKFISNQSYMTADTSNLITMQDPYYITIDGEYVKYTGQGAFELNDTVYVPVRDFSHAAGIEVLEQPNKLLLSKNSKSVEISLADNRIIQANGEVFAPAKDFVEKLGYKDKPGSYRGDLDLISTP